MLCESREEERLTIGKSRDCDRAGKIEGQPLGGALSGLIGGRDGGKQSIRVGR